MSEPDDIKITRRDEIVVRLRDDIINGTLKPGAQIRDLELARRYGASSSPVREAILQVAGERLIQSENHRFKFVAPLDKRMTQELFEMIRVLSRDAYHKAVPIITEEVLAELRDNMARQREALKNGDRAALARLSWSFRDPILALAGNREIHRTIKECYAWMQRLTILMPIDRALQVERFSNLLEALEKRDVQESNRIYEEWADSFVAIIESLPDF